MKLAPLTGHQGCARNVSGARKQFANQPMLVLVKREAQNDRANVRNTESH